MNLAITFNDRDAAFAVRQAVFIEEQGYEGEYDAIDDAPACIHVTLFVEAEEADGAGARRDACVGCARTFPRATELACAEHAHALPASPFDADAGATDATTYILGRVAVLPAYRRQGLAGRIVAAAEDAARAAGAVVMKLHAQEYVRDLYAKLGYVQISEVDYEDEGQPHLWMAKRL